MDALRAGEVVMFSGAYKGKKVLVTGHTGFKGSWLTAWLLRLGAEVAGYSIDVPTEPSNFLVLGLDKRIRDCRGDIRDRAAFARAVDEFRPDVVLHLAAQALVRLSYDRPAETFEVNALGTLNVLEVLRERPWVSAAVIITSDKAYRNVEWVWGYRESDHLGGDDPYSGSKGAAELVAYSYMRSYFRDSRSTAVATARAGNVIGGGDWALDRIIPDCVKAWSRGETVTLRHPEATRPWQHVLEPLSGYLALGARLLQRQPNVLGESYNFGPPSSVNESVETLIKVMSSAWPAAQWKVDESGRGARHEARLLKLSCDKALADLSWHAVLAFPETVTFTAAWYRNYYEHGAKGMFAFAESQIDRYCELARERRIAWSLDG
jgi:CDP-glucose 4,6-dehydratase